MFLQTVLRRNSRLLETAFKLHQGGLIEPDTYILDLDAIIENAKSIKREADKYNIKLYFMTKQFGRNPYVARELMKLGYDGAVVVDFREMDIMYKNGIKIGNVGHLVQIPSNKIEETLVKRPEVITVYSVEKAAEISRGAVKLGINQNIMLRVIDSGDILYPAQYGGFYLRELGDKVRQISSYPNINIYGITSFPCFLFNESTGKIESTNNMYTLIKARKIIEEQFNIKLVEINTPSATCTRSIKEIAAKGGTHGEPGHGLLGTTPLHAVEDEPEIPAIVYVSEVSHNLGRKSYCYGGGHYRRSHMKNVLIGRNLDTAQLRSVSKPELESIDYYLETDGNSRIGDTAVFSFRTQIFVTRSKVAVVKGIQNGNASIVGIYDSQGKED